MTPLRRHLHQPREHFLELIDMGIDRTGVGFRSTPVVLGCTPEEARRLA